MQQFSYLREKPLVDYLKIIANVGTLISAESFSNVGAILSSPEALETLTSQYKWNTSSAVTVCVSKVVFTGVIYASAGLLVYGKASASCEAKQCPGGRYYVTGKMSSFSVQCSAPVHMFWNLPRLNPQIDGKQNGGELWVPVVFQISSSS